VKILHTASCGWGGQEIRILEESSGLIGRGHEVTVACPAHARMTAEAPRFGVPVVALPIEFKTIAGFQCAAQLSGRQALRCGEHPQLGRFLADGACLRHAEESARHRAYPSHLCAGLGQLCQPLDLPAGKRRGDDRRKLAAAPAGHARARSVARCLGAHRNRYRALSRRPTSTAAKIALGLDPAHRHLGIVATLRSWKGHLFLLDAFAQLDRADLHLLIVGEGPMRGPIEEKVAALGLGGRVTMAGQRTDPERWLQSMDVFCLPSYANEGVPQAILQAMLCALPIVTTPVGAILEAVSDGETALVVPPRDAAALAAAISRLLDDTVLAKRLGAAARNVASTNFSKESMLDKMEGLFALAQRGAA
jgi:hypothetical protein